MAHHQKLRTDDFDERGRNQYNHDDITPRGNRQGDTYEERNFGHSHPSESRRSSYASSGRAGAYGQNNQSLRQGDQTRPDNDFNREQGRQQDRYNDRRRTENFDQGRSYGRAAQQRGEFQYYTRDNDQFRGYPDDNDRRRYATRQDDAPSYVHYQHQRPGGITPRDYHQDDARVRGHEASRNRDQYSRGFSDRGHDPYAGGYDQGQQHDDERGYRGYTDDDRPDRRRDQDQRNSRQEFGYGNDYSSSLYDDNGRNRTNHGHDNHDERRNHDDDRNRQYGRGSHYMDDRYNHGR